MSSPTQRTLAGVNLSDGGIAALYIDLAELVAAANVIEEGMHAPLAATLQ